MIKGRHGDYRLVSPDSSAGLETVGRIQFDSEGALRRVCLMLAANIPSAGLTELIDSLWRIKEFYGTGPAPKLLGTGSSVTMLVPMGEVVSRPSVWLDEE